MGTVYIGSARGDENGKAYGGQAGDQTGREVSTQAWYKHAKGWVLLRPRDPAKAERIAACMEAACANANIGYDQDQRDTLYSVAKPLGFDCSKVATPCETDCSALVRVCCAFAGIMVASFRTTNEAAVLVATGEFELLTDAQYTESSTYLKRGDILNTTVQGHTVVVLNDGTKAGSAGYTTLRRGSYGDAVTDAQKRLIAHGFALPKYGADGDFGAETEAAVKAFQAAKGLEVDGVVGPKTWAALTAEPAKTYRLIVSAYQGKGLTQTQATNLRDELQVAGYGALMQEG